MDNEYIDINFDNLDISFDENDNYDITTFDEINMGNMMGYGLDDLDKYSDNYVDIDVNNLMGGGIIDTFKNLFKKCKKEYPLIEELPENANILDNLFPSSVVGSGAYTSIVWIANALSRITPDSTGGKTIEMMIQSIVATLATIASLGAGGDMIVNLLFTIKKGIFFVATIIRTIDNIVGTMTIPEEQLQETLNLGRDIDGNSDQEIVDVPAQIDPNSKLFIANLLSVDFRDGPKGVECWVKQIFKKYNNIDTSLFVCEALRPIYPALASFIANIIGGMIPDVGVVVINSIQLAMSTKKGQNMGIKIILKLIRKFYKQIPKGVRKMLQDPILMDETITNLFTSLQDGLHDIFGHYEQERAKGEAIVDAVEDAVAGQMESEIEQDGSGLFRVLSAPARKVISTTGTVGKYAVKYGSKMVGLDKVIAKQLVKFDAIVEIVIKYSKLLSYMISKLLAFSFTMLYVFQRCNKK